MLSIQGSLFYIPEEKKVQAEGAKKRLVDPTGDHLSLLNIWKEWEENNFSKQWCYENFIQHRAMKRAKDVKDQLNRLCQRVELIPSTSEDTVVIRKALLSGYFLHAACLQQSGETYRTLKHSHTIFAHPGSLLFKQTPRWVIYHELVLTSKAFMRQITEIEPEWLLEVAPHYMKKSDLDKLDEKWKNKLM